MKKQGVVLAVAVLCIFATVVCVFANDIIWDDVGGGNMDVRVVLVDPGNPQTLYIGSRGAIFKSEDGGVSWRNIFSVRGRDQAVNFLLFDPADENSVYAATSKGLICSTNRGRNWKRIFRGKDYLENECTTMAVLPEAIYLGTKSGLFVSKDLGRSWHKETAGLGNTYIFAVVYNPKEPRSIYVAATDGVFKSEDSGQSWERVFVASPTENGNDDSEIIEDQDEAGRSSRIRYISIDPNNAGYLYLATANGIYQSKDAGGTWDSFSDYGLLNKEVQFLLISQGSRIYAATKSGIYEYAGERWEELSLRLTAEKPNFLVLDNRNNLYAATDQGLFLARIDDTKSGQETDLILLYCQDEPGINEVQQAAVKYAEVEPEKIIRWRRQAAKKALLPKLSVGIDRNVNDLWHWEGGSTTKVDDDFLRRGRDAIGWDVSLSWDLSELIYSGDQTTIDIRSKLMVQLRDDILDEVTKLYFERLRVKMEIDSLSIEERKKRLKTQLRLRELTAMLDGLTGGYFSAALSLTARGNEGAP